jgi:uncharacterized BrkB/YihY/UPF0761 family membrane protein
MEHREERDLEEDPRYRYSARGAALFGVVYTLIAAITLTLGFTLGTRPAEEMTFILGFPDWVFWTLIVWQAAVVVIVVLLVRLAPYYEDIPLTPSGDPEEDEER